MHVRGQPNRLRRPAATARPTTAGLRQGPLRLRLRPPPAPADAPLIRARCAAQDAGDSTVDPDNLISVVPRGDGKKRWIRRRRAGASAATAARREGAGRLRLGQGQQTRRRTSSRSSVRTGFPAATTSTTARGCATPVSAALAEGIGSGAVSNPVDGRDARRGGHPDRRQPDGQPPGGGDLDQERGPQRHAADRLPTRAGPTGAPRTGFLQFRPDTTSRCSTR